MKLYYTEASIDSELIWSKKNEIQYPLAGNICDKCMVYNCRIIGIALANMVKRAGEEDTEFYLPLGKSTWMFCPLY